MVIPAYNEERRIVSTLQHVLAYLEGQTYTWEVLVADDGSADATPKLVSEMAQSREDGRLIHLPLLHGGKGWAVRHGMLEAQGQYRFMCDADLSMSIDQLERFLPPVVAARVRRGRWLPHRARCPAHRRARKAQGHRQGLQPAGARLGSHRDCRYPVRVQVLHR